MDTPLVLAAMVEAEVVSIIQAVLVDGVEKVVVLR